MSSALSLILVVVGAYLAAHIASRWLAKRFLIVSGAEYLLLGVLLGPQVSGLIGAGVFDDFAPFMTLALGWIGALVGAQFHLPNLLRYSGHAYRIAFSEAVATGAVVGGAMLLAFTELFGVALADAVAPAVVMGAVATASSPAGIAIVARRLGHKGPVVHQLQITTAIDAFVAISAFGLLLAIIHVGPTSTGIRPLTPTEWAVVAVGIGVLGGALFHLFLGEEKKVDRLFIALAGAIILASGAAAYLRLSPLLPAMLIGAILINTSSSREQIHVALSSVERPIYFVLLIFAGAAWRPVGWSAVLPVVLFLLARIAMKTYGARAVAWSNGALPVLGPQWGRALLGQGGLAVAIGLNFMLYNPSELANLVFTATLASVLLTDVGSARVADMVVRAARRRRGRGAEPALETSGGGEATVR